MSLKKTIALFCLALGLAAGARAADEAAKTAAPDRQTMIERHEKMAELHKQVAECLKAGKDVQECHQAMVKQCPMAKDGSCPMMGKKGACPMCMGGKGMRGRGMGKGMGRGMGPGANAPAAQPAPKDETKKP